MSVMVFVLISFARVSAAVNVPKGCFCRDIAGMDVVKPAE
jgi:hypothetical protein